MRKSLILIAVTTTILILGGCKKEKMDQPGRVDIITASPWKISRMMEEKNGVVQESLYNGFPTCIKDNEYAFSKDSSLVVTEGLTRCDPTYPDLVRLAGWNLANGDQVLHYLWDYSLAQDWNILSISKDSMVLQAMQNVTLVTVTYVH